MLTPYDWQEAIGHRAQFIESRIQAGVPVVALSIDEGIVAGTYRRQSPKIYEVYDRLMYAAIGQQSDIESLRVAAIDFAHREGYQRSEQDVTIQRVVNALTQPIKEAFANFSSAPWVAKAMFVEVGESVADDRYYTVDYDGDFAMDTKRSCLAGFIELEQSLERGLGKLKVDGKKPREVAGLLKTLLTDTIKAQAGEDALSGLTFEAALLARHKSGDRRFVVLD